MTCRLAAPSDRDALLALLLRLSEHSPYTRKPADAAHLSLMLDRLLARDEVSFHVAEDRDGGLVGLLVLVVYSDLVSGERLAAEVCWYLDPSVRGHGLGRALLDRGERWARSVGASAMQMVAPTPKFEAYYRRVGYAPRDRVYERSLTSCHS